MNKEDNRNINESIKNLNTDLSGYELIKSYVKDLPQKPGVYRMLDNNGEVLYVGKAKKLKNRVQSYTRTSGHNSRIMKMIISTAAMEFIITNSEAEALLLEANLIKKLKPKYNILLRDDKSLPYILLSKKHNNIRLLKHRGVQKEPGDYYGPFASNGAVNKTINVLQRGFLLRTCTDSVYENRTRPCLLYQIKRCSAPCTGEISPNSYQQLVNQTKDFLNGKSDKIRQKLITLMEQSSAKLDYEHAAIYRDRIAALAQIQAHQGINTAKVGNADIIAIAEVNGYFCIQTFFFRSGQNWGNRSFFPKVGSNYNISEVLESFISQFYNNKSIPEFLFLSHNCDNIKLITQAFTLQSGHSVKILVPQRGIKLELVKQAELNAKEALARKIATDNSHKLMLDKMADLFNMPSSPERIEVYDNSHIQGANQVGAMIVSDREGFCKNQYRKFNIKNSNITPGDDYGMMREVLTRRFANISPDNNKYEKLPDIVIIDGGKGQLMIAKEVFKKLNISDITLVAIAKGPDRNAGMERFFMPEKNEFSLPNKDPLLYYIQQLRDEAHRFAIGSHRNKRKQALTKSKLDEIPGIGAKRKKDLLRHFGSVKAVTSASLIDLKNVKGISEITAQIIYDYFHGDNNES